MQENTYTERDLPLIPPESFTDIINHMIEEGEKYIEKFNEENKDNKREPLLILEMHVIDEIDEKWANGNYRIPKVFDDIDNKGKYIQSRNDLINGLVDEPPFICINSETDTVGFTDGRNRFSNLRDSGFGDRECPFMVQHPKQ